ncbi:MAG: nucleotide sugar dehydrogenase [Gammaproteobacteria bacterium]
MKPLSESTICIIGLGYVGLPLAVAFGKTQPTIGYDRNSQRVEALLQGEDATLEVSSTDLQAATHATYTADPSQLAAADIFIVTVPTPITRSKQPDLKPLLAASTTIGQYLRPGNVVIYESTVFPGATEELCVPVLEHQSGLKLNEDFFVGYSPERIVPGDKKHKLETITKITSGSTPEAAKYIDDLYRSIVTAGTHRAESIQVAEAAKVIENVQRDINISLVNEIAVICNKLNLDTLQVLEAAGTKWNFLPFKPGLVGGHCIGIDPYYLTHRAQEVGYHPEVILSGRRLNDNMGYFIAETVVKLMIGKGHSSTDADVLVMGLTFKENCPDIRNTKIVDLIAGLEEFGMNVDIHDPWADPGEAQREYGVSLIDTPKEDHYAAVIMAVPHSQFKEAGIERIREYGQSNFVLYDIKGLFDINEVDGRL